MNFENIVEKINERLGVSYPHYLSEEFHNEKELCQTYSIYINSPKFKIQVLEYDGYDTDSGMQVLVNVRLDFGNNQVSSEIFENMSSIIKSEFEQQNKILKIISKIFPDIHIYNNKMKLKIDVIDNELRFGDFLFFATSNGKGYYSNNIEFNVEDKFLQLLKNFGISEDVKTVLNSEEHLILLDMISI